MTCQLTNEQNAAIASEAKKTRVYAYSGTGKTTLLVGFAKARPAKRFLMLCYNKAIALENDGKFGHNTKVRTSHKLAYSTVGKYYKDRLRNISYMDAKELLETTHWTYVKHCLETLRAFYCSADTQISIDHFLAAKDPISEKVRDYNERVVKGAVTLWNLQDDPLGTCPVEFDFYLKKYLITSAERVAKQYDYILVDEFQDTTPALLDFIKRVDVPTVVVGDEYQQMYRYRGAVDALQDPYYTDEQTETFRLTRSFRFGQRIANVANAVLTMLGQKVLVQTEKTGDIVLTALPGSLDQNKNQVCYLHRRVASAIATGIEMAEQNRSTYWVGGIDNYDLARIRNVAHLALNHLDKIHDKKFKHSFKSLQEFKDYADGTLDLEALRAIKLVEDHTPLGLLGKLALLKQLAKDEESDALAVISTVHRAKGLEFDWVVLRDMSSLDDLLTPKPDADSHWEKIRDEMHLYYVAATRAKNGLVVDKNFVALGRMALLVRAGKPVPGLPPIWQSKLGLPPATQQQSVPTESYSFNPLPQTAPTHTQPRV